MERITREQMLMDVAHVVARRGTCSRAQVGVVFAREGRILVTGYNGAPRGMNHCTHETYTWPPPLYTGEGRSIVHPYPSWMERMLAVSAPEAGKTYYFDGRTLSTNPGCTVVEHSERNAIAFAARHGIALWDSDVFCTHAPCLDCARALLSTGIRSLTYETPYRITAGVELLSAQGIQVIDNSVPA